MRVCVIKAPSLSFQYYFHNHLQYDILNNLKVKSKWKGYFNNSLCMCVGLHMCLHTCKDPRLVLVYSLSQDLSHTFDLTNLSGHLTLGLSLCGWTNREGRPASLTWFSWFWGSELQVSGLCDQCYHQWAINHSIPNFYHFIQATYLKRH